MIITVMILSSLISASLGRQNPPHIIFIVADDLGWNDVGWHNKDIQTPNLNKLAKKGVILDQSYVQPLCTPWHLGYCSLKYTPTHRGFDSFFGFYGGSEGYFNHSIGDIGTSRYHYDFRFNDEVFHPPGNKYSSELFADRVIDIIDDVDPKKQPLYLYIPFQSVHGPFEVPRKYKDMYRHTKSTERQTYCGMVTALDDAVGKIANALETKGFMENALLVFTTDNGGKMYSGADNSPLRGGKSTLWEGGTRGVSFVYSKTLLKKTKYVNNRMIHVVDWFPTLLTLAGGKPDSNLDGVNQWKTLSEDTESARDEFIYNIDEIMDYSAIRKGKYKLITGTHDGKLPDEINLFDLQNDPFEKVNIADQNADIVEQLGQRLEMYRKTSVPFRSVPDNNHLAKTIGRTLSPGWC